MQHQQPPQQPYAPQQHYPPQGPQGYGHPPPQPRGGMSTGIIVLIIGACMIPVLGILAAIAIPAFVKYTRRSKSAEARGQIAKMFDAVSAYHAEHGRCPGEGVEGHAGVTPPLSVDCNDNPKGRCVQGAVTAEGYDKSLWTEHPVWKQLQFDPGESHYFHYDLRWHGNEDGACQFEVQAFGDLDDDGVFSTYERAGAADEMGINAAAGLYIDNELE